MSKTIISVDNVSKQYRLGEINTGMFYGDIKRWWAKKRGLSGEFSKVGASEPDAGNSIHGADNTEVLWALKDINFTLNQGEVLGIIGRNGSGKSTLLKILSRVTAPTSGEVKINGRVASLLEVGTGFHPELTGRENVFLNSAILGMSKSDVRKKFDEIVDFSGVEKFIDTPVKHYSSGMYVRLAFSVASFLNSEILILDEVLAVGDAGFQKKSMERMEAAAKSGRTVLFVSHSLASVLRLCDRGIYLEQGNMLYVGSASDTVSTYLKTIHQIDEERLATEGGNPTRSYLELGDNVKRWGDCKKILTWVSTHRVDGQPATEFKTGEGMKIRIGYHLDDYLNSYCNINFLNYTGLAVMTVGLHHTKPDARLFGDGYLECYIPDLRLVSGNYILMLSIGEHDVKNNDRRWIDSVSDTIHIKVDMGDYLNGYEVSQMEAYFAQRSEWEISTS